MGAIECDIERYGRDMGEKTLTEGGREGQREVRRQEGDWGKRRRVEGSGRGGVYEIKYFII